VLERLAATGAAGAYAWCYADYAPELYVRAPFDRALRERSFGLIRSDGSEKPAVEVIRAFASRLERGEVQLGEAPRLLDVTADEYYTAPNEHFGRLYEQWLEHMT
jgi:endo-1,4-beta-mannosidase